MSRSWDGRVSWFSVSRRRAAWNGSPGRSIRFISIACVTVKLDVSGSGTDSTSRLYVGSPQDTKPSGGFFLTTWRSFFWSSPNLAVALAIAFTFSVTCSGAWTTTVPAVS